MAALSLHSGSAAFGGGESGMKEFRVPSAPQMVLILRQGHEGSEYVLSFEIGQRESGFYSARTDTQNHKHTEPSSSALVYRLH